MQAALNKQCESIAQYTCQIENKEGKIHFKKEAPDYQSKSSCLCLADKADKKADIERQNKMEQERMVGIILTIF